MHRRKAAPFASEPGKATERRGRTSAPGPADPPRLLAAAAAIEPGRSRYAMLRTLTSAECNMPVETSSRYDLQH